MIDPQTLILFAGACVVLALIPGPDNLFVSAQSLSLGRSAGLAAALGIIVGGVLWTIAAVIGLTAVIAKLPAVFQIIQIAGAGYLIYLAVDLWTKAGQLSSQPAAITDAFRRGLTTNLLNPKVGLYYLAFLPQFVATAGPPVWVQMLVLGAIFNLVGGAVMLSVAVLAGSVQQSAPTGSNREQWLPRIGALVLFGIAGNLLWRLMG